MKSKFWRSILIGCLIFILNFVFHLYSPLQGQRSSSALDLIQQGKEYYDLGQFNAAEISLKQALENYKNNDNKI